ncbi:MAG: adenylate/guanylate cyclase domain-containing protein [Spirochaetia bacterium]|nr:adenylate/guanylate cyclase domain-containing protein [Spirochaetia bacterium]
MPRAVMHTEIDFLKDLTKRLDLYFLEGDDTGRIRTCSGGFLRNLGYDPGSTGGITLFTIFEEASAQELFGRKFSIWQNGLRFYRAKLKNSAGELIYYDVSGSMDVQPGGRRYRLMLRELGPMDLSLETGPFLENVHAYSIAQRYISKDLIQRARRAASSGQKNLLNETRVLTFLFADLVSFTAYSEKRNPDEVVQMLNLSIGAASSNIIHYNGLVDKIMGDSVFAIFEEPLNAILAAVEMQKQFQILNLFNVKNNQDEIQVRIGIHTGECIQASLGTDDHMEWTAIGDSVNIASRLEKAAAPGTILVSAATVDVVRDNLSLVKEVEIAVKGKSVPLKGYYINRVTFQGPRGPISLGVDDDVF